MDLSKEEIEEELAHKQEIIRLLMRRRRPLELQAAKKGDDAPPDVLNEIADITDKIRAQEEEATQLRTLAVEDKLSAPEADYRVLLAKIFNTTTGRPTIAGSAQLEKERLQIGLASERAQELEKEVRAGLAAETLSDLDLAPSREYLHQYEQVLRAFRLDRRTARQILAVQLHEDMATRLTEEATDRRLWVYKTERSLFLRFLADLRILSAVNTAVRRSVGMLQDLSKLAVTVDGVASGCAAAEKSLKDALHAFGYGREIVEDDALPSEIVEAVSSAVEQAYAVASGFQSHLNKVAQDDEAVSRASSSTHNAVLAARYAYNLLQNPVSPGLILPLTDCLRATSLAIINATNLMRKLLHRPQSGEDSPGVVSPPATNRGH